MPPRSHPVTHPRSHVYGCLFLARCKLFSSPRRLSIASYFLPLVSCSLLIAQCSCLLILASRILLLEYVDRKLTNPGFRIIYEQTTGGIKIEHLGFRGHTRWSSGARERAHSLDHVWYPTAGAGDSPNRIMLVNLYALVSVVKV